ncbi:MAG: IclR family transcriptional regulator [SAR324 cluster bacterium]|nr:IclR family transcriptional regulator [SAR324 cluster bacterium]MBL7035352.1 IclR family transcriptional regulator [SAR324 cluster bacterium]
MDDNFLDKGSAMHRILAILEQVAGTERPVSPTDINEKLKLPKATIHRLCSTLEDELFLQREIDGKRYLPGTRLRKIALGVMSNEYFRAQRKAVLMRLSEDIGETCNISIPDGNQMRYLDRAESHWPLRLQLPVGTKVPLHCTSSGKLFLSLLSREQLSSLLDNLNLEQKTANTLTTKAALVKALAKIRKDQVGTDNQEFVEGMICVAVPIFDRRERFFATLSIHAPTTRMSLEELSQHIPLLQKASQNLTLIIDPGDN